MSEKVAWATYGSAFDGKIFKALLAASKTTEHTVGFALNGVERTLAARRRKAAARHIVSIVDVILLCGARSLPACVLRPLSLIFSSVKQ